MGEVQKIIESDRTSDGGTVVEWRGKKIDAMWKEVLLTCVDDAVLFFLPDLAEARDTSQPIGFTREELPKIEGDSDKGMRIADAAFSVPLKGGGGQRVVFLVEQQHERDLSFGRRMFVEYYRMSDRMEVPVTSLAIFTGQLGSADRYDTTCFGTKLSFEFNSYMVADVDVEVLKADERAFAVVVLAAKRMLDAGGDPRKREKYARELISLMRKRDYDREKKRNILTFVGKALRLKDGDINRETREEWNMITIPLEEAVEKIKLHNAFEDGLEAGLEKGKKETAEKMLAHGMEPEIIADLAGLSLNEVLSLRRKH